MPYIRACNCCVIVGWNSYGYASLLFLAFAVKQPILRFAEV